MAWYDYGRMYTHINTSSETINGTVTDRFCYYRTDKTGTTSAYQGRGKVRFGYNKKESKRFCSGLYLRNILSGFKQYLKNAVIDVAIIEFIPESVVKYDDVGIVYLYSYKDKSFSDQLLQDNSSKVWKPSKFNASNNIFDGDPLGFNKDIQKSQTEYTVHSRQIIIDNTTNCERFRQKILEENYVFALYHEETSMEEADGYNEFSSNDTISVTIIWHYKFPDINYLPRYVTNTFSTENPSIQFYFGNNDLTFIRDSCIFRYNFDGIDSLNMDYGVFKNGVGNDYIWKKRTRDDSAETVGVWTNIDSQNIQFDSENNIWTYTGYDFVHSLQNNLFDIHPKLSDLGYVQAFSMFYSEEDASNCIIEDYSEVNVHLNDNVVPLFSSTPIRSVYKFNNTNAPNQYITDWTGDKFTYSVEAKNGAYLVSISLKYDNHSDMNTSIVYSSSPHPTQITNGSIESPFAYKYTDSAKATIIVYDSRGRSASYTNSLTSQYVLFRPPYFNQTPVVYRSNISGTELDNGQYISIDYSVWKMGNLSFNDEGQEILNYSVIDFSVMYDNVVLGHRTVSAIDTGKCTVSRSNYEGIDSYDSNSSYVVDSICKYTENEETHRYRCIDATESPAGNFDHNKWRLEDFEPDKLYFVKCSVRDLGLYKKTGSSSTYRDEYKINVPVVQYIIHIKEGGKAIAFGTAATTDNTLSSKWDIQTIDQSANVRSKMGGGALSTNNIVASGKNFLFTLSVNDWTDSNQQIIEVNGLLIDAIIIVSPAPSSISGYTENGVYCSSQSNGSITFSCATKPTANIDVNVLALGKM